MTYEETPTGLSPPCAHQKREGSLGRTTIYNYMSYALRISPRKVNLFNRPHRPQHVLICLPSISSAHLLISILSRRGTSPCVAPRDPHQLPRYHRFPIRRPTPWASPICRDGSDSPTQSPQMVQAPRTFPLTQAIRKLD